MPDRFSPVGVGADRPELIVSAAMRRTAPAEWRVREWSDLLGVRPGLCGSCRHASLARSRRSVFLRCAMAESDPAFPRYPALPVDRCSAFSRSAGAEA